MALRPESFRGFPETGARNLNVTDDLLVKYDKMPARARYNIYFSILVISVRGRFMLRKLGFTLKFLF